MTIFKDDFEKAEKAHKELIGDVNRATALVDDAIARYIKKKTGARSRKQATEKEALINSAKFEPLKMYDRREDIQEEYGWGFMTEKRRDKLEDLWDEREELKKKTVDGVYSDRVTEILNKAKLYILGLYEDEFGEFDETQREWNKQVEETRKFRQEMQDDYRDWKNGWGKYRKPEEHDENS